MVHPQAVESGLATVSQPLAQIPPWLHANFSLLRVGGEQTNLPSLKTNTGEISNLGELYGAAGQLYRCIGTNSPSKTT